MALFLWILKIYNFCEIVLIGERKEERETGKRGNSYKYALIYVNPNL